MNESQKRREVELVSLGAWLAMQAYRDKVVDFSEGDLSEVLTGLRNSNTAPLKRWLLSRGVVWDSGKAVEAVQRGQELARLETQIRRQLQMSQLALKLCDSQRSQECMEQVLKLRGQHEAIKAEQTKRTTIAVNTQARETAETAQGSTKAESRPTAVAAIQGGDRGVRVRAVEDHPATGRTRGAIGQPPYRPDQARQAGMPAVPVSAVP